MLKQTEYSKALQAKRNVESSFRRMLRFECLPDEISRKMIDTLAEISAADLSHYRTDVVKLPGFILTASELLSLIKSNCGEPSDRWVITSESIVTDDSVLGGLDKTFFSQVFGVATPEMMHYVCVERRYLMLGHDTVDAFEAWLIAGHALVSRHAWGAVGYAMCYLGSGDDSNNDPVLLQNDEIVAELKKEFK